MNSKNLRPLSLPHSVKTLSSCQDSRTSSARHYSADESDHLDEAPRNNAGEREKKNFRVLTERRRTQMRQAQRKYRFKKDATIALLQQRNRELKCALSSLKSITKQLKGEIAALQNMDGSSTAMKRLQTITIRLLTEVEKAEEGPSHRLSPEHTPLALDTYRIHSPSWQTSTAEHDTPDPISALGYEVLGHQRIDAP